MYASGIDKATGGPYLYHQILLNPWFTYVKSINTSLSVTAVCAVDMKAVLLVLIS